MRRSSVRAALLVAAAALLGLAAVALAPSASATAPGYAIVRGAHFSPDTPGVDVYLTSLAGGTSTLWLSGVGYGDVSPYNRLPAGDLRGVDAAAWCSSLDTGGIELDAQRAGRQRLHGRRGRNERSAARDRAA